MLIAPAKFFTDLSVASFVPDSSPALCARTVFTDEAKRELTGPRFDRILELYQLRQKLQDRSIKNMINDETSLLASDLIHFYLFPKDVDQLAAMSSVVKHPECPPEFHQELVFAGMAADSDQDEVAGLGDGSLTIPRISCRQVALKRLDNEV
ncbi:hypothetical protein MBLNU13_g09851t2 [Cladosporium sp. NU13]